ncbi:MAG: response regulator transcription factor [Meiothermus sp.]|nr:response regulator transcription factor [Meiothermus sp.]
MPTVGPAEGLILVIEDDPQIAEILEGFLRREGFRTERARDGEVGLTLHRLAKPDLVLLDVQMPGMDGFEVLKRIRETSTTPVIMVTAMAEDLDKLLGLRMGADDYVVKPFSPLEVVARVKAVLRRVAGAGPGGPLRLAGLEIDPQAMVVLARGQRLDLTLTEFRILEHLARHPNRTFSRPEILERVMPESDALERSVDVHLQSLRRKLERAGVEGLLESVRGVGYRLWVGV